MLLPCHKARLAPSSVDSVGAPALWFASTEDQRNDEQNDEYPKQDLRNSSHGAGKTAKSKYCRYQGNDEKKYRIVKHGHLPSTESQNNCALELCLSNHVLQTRYCKPRLASHVSEASFLEAVHSTFMPAVEDCRTRGVENHAMACTKPNEGRQCLSVI